MNTKQLLNTLIISGLLLIAGYFLVNLSWFAFCKIGIEC